MRIPHPPVFIAAAIITFAVLSASAQVVVDTDRSTASLDEKAGIDFNSFSSNIRSPMPVLYPYIPPVFSGGIAIAPMISWYSGMPLVASAFHGIDRMNASGIGWSAGVSGTWWITDGSGRAQWPEMGVRAGLRYNRQSVSAEQDVTMLAQVDLDRDDTTDPVAMPALVRVNASADFDLLNLSAAFVLRPGSLSLFLGPSISYVVGSNHRESVHLIETTGGSRFDNPSMYPTEDEGRLLILHDDTPANRSTTRFGISGAVQVELPLSSTFSLLPAVEYEYVFGSEGSGAITDRVNSLYVHLALVRHFE